MIKVRNVSFAYPGNLALDDISLEVKRGSITALVGPNGAGKTTLFRCIASLELPTSGSVIIDGTDVTENPQAGISKTGYLPDFFGLYDDLTVSQCLLFAASAQNIPTDQQEAAVHRAAERLKITDRMSHKAAHLSRGLRQRLAIAISIIHEPVLLLLDEPASGLDPEARITLSQLLISLRDIGITILVSSHILSELEDYSTHMIILKNGRIVSHDQLDASAADRSRLILQTVNKSKDAADLLQSSEGVSGVSRTGDLIYFEYWQNPKKQSALLENLISNKIPVRFFSEDKTDMNQAYLKRMTDSDKTQQPKKSKKAKQSW
jgi:ABC-2 type transport system ATP-binding protein